ncbi:hypothetical protein CXG81DRAFT_15310 [Caulochytrium protostelioides]|uniref:ATPase, V1/A1 complex, subunit E n=1 Tax=Caulochytrium protostelioides TaxID=1555241 RepID=A0A4P9X2Q9_9FUNG|nr:hypothetical protein CXG81DRAFT_15310 [Caulochytrium protostelioides]|eukprot:RKO98896.1 hypothetical protein CXG81DRAFT_15310 [Caulochytrium protostelioides]
MAGRLSQSDVDAEMRKMVSFIKQEALEKAREIKVKADEEFNIEKGKLVRQETLAIEAFHQKKQKQAETKRKIAQSNDINKARLRVLQARHQVMEDVFAESRKRLARMSADPTSYTQILRNLIMQGAFQIADEKLVVVTRKADAQMAQSVLSSVSSEFQKALERPLHITVSTREHLPDDCAGGVLVQTEDNKIRVNQTFETRLDIAAEMMLPELRIVLFGKSAQRKFYN